MNDCENCVNEHRIAALEADRERNSAQHREFYDKLTRIEVSDGVKSEQLSQLMIKVDKLGLTVEKVAEQINTSRK